MGHCEDDETRLGQARSKESYCTVQIALLSSPITLQVIVVVDPVLVAFKRWVGDKVGTETSQFELKKSYEIH